MNIFRIKFSKLKGKTEQEDLKSVNALTKTTTGNFVYLSLNFQIIYRNLVEKLLS